MYKNQLQELAQRSCFNLPSYSCIREGPDHAPRFKATVNFSGEIFESPTFCNTLRQAEHAAAEVALNVLSKKGPSKALAARVLDESGVYKNLLQETNHRAGLKLPVYTTVRSGPGHVPVFSCTVELAGMSFTGEPAKTKKQAQKNAALMAWSALKKKAKSASSASSFYPSHLPESGTNDEQDQVIIAHYLATLKQPEICNSQQRERRTAGVSAPIRRDVTPCARSVYLFQHQNRLCSQFYPELSSYQTCVQERVFQQPDHLLALSSLPFSSPRRQTSPFIQSVLQPDHGYYFPSQGQEPITFIPEMGPFLYFSNHVMPVPVRSVSQVTIQELEESQQMEEGWQCKVDGDSSCWKNNCTSNVPRLYPTEIPNSLVSFNSHSEHRMQERLQEQDEEKSSSSVPNAGKSMQLQCNQLERCNWVSPGCTYTGFRPRAITSDGAKFHLKNPDHLVYLQSSFRPPNPAAVSSSGSVRGFVPASHAAPLTVRTSAVTSTGNLRPESSNTFTRPTRIAPSTCSSQSWPEGMKNQGTPLRHFMAPAVHIRSVVPVCSAPPAKKFPGPDREELLSGIENKRTEELRADISAASSDFSKLRL